MTDRIVHLEADVRPPPSASSEPAPGGFDMAGYRAVLWQARKRLSYAAGVGVVAAVVLLQVLPYQYESTVVVGPPNADNTIGGLGSGLAALGGIAGAASALLNSGSTDYDEFNQLLDSNTLGDYIAKHNPELLHSMYSTRWDDQNKRWDNSGIINATKDAIKILFGFPPWQVPNGEDVKKYIEKKVDVSNDYKTNFTTISYSDEDPAVAKQLVDAIYLGVDAIVREQARQRTAKRIAYLTKTIPTVTQSAERDALIELIENEEQTQMMVRSDEYYSMSPVDLPTVAERPAWPPNLLFIIGGAMLAFGIEFAHFLFWPNASPLKWLRARFARQHKTVTATTSRTA